MKQTYLFEADNLGFRPFEEGDLNYLLMLDADPETMSFFPGGVRARHEIKDNIKKYITAYNEKGYSIFLVFDTSSQEFIGRAGFGDIENGETEVGYLVLKKYWGKGYATKILKVLLAWANNNIKKDKIIAFTPIAHAASERVMQKAGMVFSRKGIMKGVECVIYEYKLTNELELINNPDVMDPIELTFYNPQWPYLAELEIKRLREILPAQHVLDIQHLGSTAIPGIKAKPIIDIQVAVDSLLAIKQAAIDALKPLGYEYWADNPDQERMFFVKGMPPFGDKRTHHVHIVEPASRHWQEKIQFRDYLLSHPEAVQEYEELKIKLADQYTYDREKYTEAKTQFVNEILEKAQANFANASNLPFVLFLTGASGAGKTTIVNSFNQDNSNQAIISLHFDSIGVPSVDEMTKIYGSPSEWQKAMTYHWIQNIINDYGDKKLVILEGQVNLDFITSAFVGFNFKQYKIILVHCNKSVRHQRLHQQRNQPELVNENMDTWAEFLKKQAIEKNVTILDTTMMKASEMIEEFKNSININKPLDK